MLSPRCLLQALGIDALHRMGIIHRDLKPENILVDASNLGRDPNVRIADFNTAFISYSPLEDGTVCANDKIGSAPYMAWEVDRGQWYGKMVDWWALGCIAFGMLTNTVSARHSMRIFSRLLLASY